MMEIQNFVVYGWTLEKRVRRVSQTTLQYHRKRLSRCPFAQGLSNWPLNALWHNHGAANLNLTISTLEKS